MSRSVYFSKRENHNQSHVSGPKSGPLTLTLSLLSLPSRWILLVVHFGYSTRLI
jgi:hypothetical protein